MAFEFSENSQGVHQISHFHASHRSILSSTTKTGSLSHTPYKSEAPESTIFLSFFFNRKHYISKDVKLLYFNVVILLPILWRLYFV